MLKPIFQDCSYVELPGYDIKYGRTAGQTRIRLLFQIPQILARIRKEKQWLRRFLSTNSIQGIISDNRYGLYDPGIPSVLITHQLQVQTGAGRLTNKLLQLSLYRFIRRFSHCWVPDTATAPGTAGSLSHPSTLPLTTTSYLGCLSRFESCAVTEESILLILLSGPEPQRTILEKLLLQQLPEIKEPVVLVRGGSSETTLNGLPNNVTVLNHAGTAELNSLLCKARLVIARSGYTTVMDLLKLKKKSILIPTPGQAEQEYLGKHLMQQQWVLTLNQQHFSLQTALTLAENFPYEPYNQEMEQYKEVVKKWVWNLT